MGKNYTYVPGAAFPYQYKYEHMAVTTDCAIFTYEDWKLKVLLVRRGGEPYKGQWAFPGGFLKMDETAEQGARRELREETGLVPSAIGQLGVFSDVDRDPRERVITIAWYALVKPSEVVGGDDADEAAWFPVDALPPLAFDHRKIFEAAMERLRRDIHFQPVGFDLLDDEFTIRREVRPPELPAEAARRGHPGGGLPRRRIRRPAGIPVSEKLRPPGDHFGGPAGGGRLRGAPRPKGPPGASRALIPPQPEEVRGDEGRRRETRILETNLWN